MKLLKSLGVLQLRQDNQRISCKVQPARRLPVNPGEHHRAVKGHALDNAGSGSIPDLQLRPRCQRSPRCREVGVVIIASVRVHAPIEPAAREHSVNVARVTRP